MYACRVTEVVQIPLTNFIFIQHTAVYFTCDVSKVIRVTPFPLPA